MKIAIHAVLQSYQSQALTSSRVAAQAGAPVALQSIQKGKQRRKSDFSRQQALFGEFFRNKLMPKALAALAAKIRQGWTIILQSSLLQHKEKAYPSKFPLKLAMKKCLESKQEQVHTPVSCTVDAKSSSNFLE